MAKRHDENKCLRSFKRIGRVDMYDKTLQASKNAVIGIHLWGKIDYLTKYCGWHFIWNNNATPVYTQNSDDSNNNDVTKSNILPVFFILPSLNVFLFFRLFFLYMYTV